MNDIPFKIPLNQFLEFFKISLGEYLNLQEIPFPLITEAGCVVYHSIDKSNGYEALFYQDTRSNNPLSELSVEVYSVHPQDLFVDFRIYDNDCSRLFFRDTNINVDEHTVVTDTSSNFLKSCQTTHSRKDLYYENGFIDNCEIARWFKDRELNFYTETSYDINYQFHNLDIVNSVSPYYATILSGKYEGMLSDDSLQFNRIENNLTTNQKGNANMTNSKVTQSVVGQTIDKNKQAMVQATKLEVGSLALDLVVKQVVKVFPEPFQAIVENNPMVKIAVANLISLVVQQTNIQDPKLLAVTDAVMTVSWMETLKSFDFASMLQGVLSTLPAGKVETLVQDSQ